MERTNLAPIVDLNREQHYTAILEMQVENLRKQIRILEAGLHGIRRIATGRGRGATAKLDAINKVMLQATWAKNIVELDPTPNGVDPVYALDEVLALCRDGCDDADLDETDEESTSPL